MNSYLEEYFQDYYLLAAGSFANLANSIVLASLSSELIVLRKYSQQANL